MTPAGRQFGAMSTSRLHQIGLLLLRYVDWNWMVNVQWMNKQPTPGRAYLPTTIEHFANVITHGVWVIPSTFASLELVQRAISWPQYFSALVYGAALILLFHCVHILPFSLLLQQQQVILLALLLVRSDINLYFTQGRKGVVLL
ncbi:unnamed protein product [Timema podura]|uniref:Uncharacterized protein n=1 Tax=Timema podura TaxID=61482 RepID=A0ABN7NUJ8_TIMPD|nr:unnamed protein product [Timema podura]